MSWQYTGECAVYSKKFTTTYNLVVHRRIYNEEKLN